MIHIKICGLTGLEDALKAIEAGADMLGFNFYPRSPRYVAPEVCRKIVQGLNREIPQRMETVRLVGVFVNMPPDQALAILETCNLSMAQLSGDELPSDLECLGERAFKALRAGEKQTLAQLAQSFPVRETPPAFLVDAGSAGQYGGTGQVADWDQACMLSQRLPILLAGGLSPINVAQAVRSVQPWGVDVASGVESAPGKKDFKKMAAFVEAARSACEEIVRC